MNIIEGFKKMLFRKAKEPKAEKEIIEVVMKEIKEAKEAKEETVKWTDASDEVKKFCDEHQDEITSTETNYIESENKKIWKFSTKKGKVEFEQFFDMRYFKQTQ